MKKHVSFGGGEWRPRRQPALRSFYPRDASPRDKTPPPVPPSSPRGPRMAIGRSSGAGAAETTDMRLMLQRLLAQQAGGGGGGGGGGVSADAGVAATRPTQQPDSQPLSQHGLPYFTASVTSSHRAHTLSDAEHFQTIHKWLDFIERNARWKRAKEEHDRRRILEWNDMCKRCSDLSEQSSAVDSSWSKASDRRQRSNTTKGSKLKSRIQVKNSKWNTKNVNSKLKKRSGKNVSAGSVTGSQSTNESFSKDSDFRAQITEHETSSGKSMSERKRKGITNATPYISARRERGVKWPRKSQEPYFQNNRLSKGKPVVGSPRATGANFHKKNRRPLPQPRNESHMKCHHSQHTDKITNMTNKEKCTKTLKKLNLKQKHYASSKKNSELLGILVEENDVQECNDVKKDNYHVSHPKMKSRHQAPNKNEDNCSVQEMSIVECEPNLIVISEDESKTEMTHQSEIDNKLFDVKSDYGDIFQEKCGRNFHYKSKCDSAAQTSDPEQISESINSFVSEESQQLKTFSKSIKHLEDCVKHICVSCAHTLAQKSPGAAWHKVCPGETRKSHHTTVSISESDPRCNEINEFSSSNDPKEDINHLTGYKEDIIHHKVGNDSDVRFGTTLQDDGSLEIIEVNRQYIKDGKHYLEVMYVPKFLSYKFLNRKDSSSVVCSQTKGIDLGTDIPGKESQESLREMHHKMLTYSGGKTIEILNRTLKNLKEKEKAQLNLPNCEYTDEKFSRPMPNYELSENNHLSLITDHKMETRNDSKYSTEDNYVTKNSTENNENHCNSNMAAIQQGPFQWEDETFCDDLEKSFNAAMKQDLIKSVAGNKINQHILIKIENCKQTEEDNESGKNSDAYLNKEISETLSGKIQVNDITHDELSVTSQIPIQNKQNICQFSHETKYGYLNHTITCPNYQSGNIVRKTTNQCYNKYAIEVPSRVYMHRSDSCPELSANSKCILETRRKSTTSSFRTDTRRKFSHSSPRQIRGIGAGLNTKFDQSFTACSIQEREIKTPVRIAEDMISHEKCDNDKLMYKNTSFSSSDEKDEIHLKTPDEMHPTFISLIQFDANELASINVSTANDFIAPTCCTNLHHLFPPDYVSVMVPDSFVPPSHKEEIFQKTSSSSSSSIFRITKQQRTISSSKKRKTKMHKCSNATRNAYIKHRQKNNSRQSRSECHGNGRNTYSKNTENLVRCLFPDDDIKYASGFHKRYTKRSPKHSKYLPKFSQQLQNREDMQENRKFYSRKGAITKNRQFKTRLFHGNRHLQSLNRTPRDFNWSGSTSESSSHTREHGEWNRGLKFLSPTTNWFLRAQANVHPQLERQRQNVILSDTDGSMECQPGTAQRSQASSSPTFPKVVRRDMRKRRTSRRATFAVSRGIERDWRRERKSPHTPTATTSTSCDMLCPEFKRSEVLLEIKRQIERLDERCSVIEENYRATEDSSREYLKRSSMISRSLIASPQKSPQMWSSSTSPTSETRARLMTGKNDRDSNSGSDHWIIYEEAREHSKIKSKRNREQGFSDVSLASESNTTQFLREIIGQTESNILDKNVREYFREIEPCSHNHSHCRATEERIIVEIQDFATQCECPNVEVCSTEESREQRNVPEGKESGIQCDIIKEHIIFLSVALQTECSKQHQSTSSSIDTSHVSEFIERSVQVETLYSTSRCTQVDLLSRSSVHPHKQGEGLSRPQCASECTSKCIRNDTRSIHSERYNSSVSKYNVTKFPEYDTGTCNVRRTETQEPQIFVARDCKSEESRLGKTQEYCTSLAQVTNSSKDSMRLEDSLRNNVNKDIANANQRSDKDSISCDVKDVSAGNDLSSGSTLIKNTIYDSTSSHLTGFVSNNPLNSPQKPLDAGHNSLSLQNNSRNGNFMSYNKEMFYEENGHQMGRGADYFSTAPRRYSNICINNTICSPAIDNYQISNFSVRPGKQTTCEMHYNNCDRGGAMASQKDYIMTQVGMDVAANCSVFHDEKSNYYWSGDNVSSNIRRESNNDALESYYPFLGPVCNQFVPQEELRRLHYVKVPSGEFLKCAYCGGIKCDTCRCSSVNTRYIPQVNSGEISPKYTALQFQDPNYTCSKTARIGAQCSPKESTRESDPMGKSTVHEAFDVCSGASNRICRPPKGKEEWSGQFSKEYNDSTSFQCNRDREPKQEHPQITSLSHKKVSGFKSRNSGDLGEHFVTKRKGRKRHRQSGGNVNFRQSSIKQFRDSSVPYKRGRLQSTERINERNSSRNDRIDTSLKRRSRISCSEMPKSSCSEGSVHENRTRVDKSVGGALNVKGSDSPSQNGHCNNGSQREPNELTDKNSYLSNITKIRSNGRIESQGSPNGDTSNMRNISLCHDSSFDSSTEHGQDPPDMNNINKRQQNIYRIRSKEERREICIENKSRDKMSPKEDQQKQAGNTKLNHLDHSSVRGVPSQITQEISMRISNHSCDSKRSELGFSVLWENEEEEMVEQVEQEVRVWVPSPSGQFSRPTSPARKSSSRRTNRSARTARRRDKHGFWRRFCRFLERSTSPR